MSWFKRFVALITEPTETLQTRLSKEQVVVDPMVKAPVLGFVKTVLASPHRFHCRREFPTPMEVKQYTWMTRDTTKFYRVTDKLLGHKFVVVYHQGRIYSVHGGDISLNHWEMKYLHEKLSTVFLRAADRLVRIRQLESNRQREAATNVEKARRAKWTAIYGE